MASELYNSILFEQIPFFILCGGVWFEQLTDLEPNLDDIYGL